MILNNHYKTVEIDITTYRRSQQKRYKTMTENITERFRKGNQNRFICSICLNKKSSQENTRAVECCKRISKSCPICQKHSETDEKRNDKNNECTGKGDGEKTLSDTKNINGYGQSVQSSQPDLTKGLTLLNEVLTVFQNKKQIDSKKENQSKTVILKDASVETDTIKIKPKLSFSKTFLYSIGENDEGNKNEKFSVINSEPAMKSQFSFDLKHKSSSIPQMKLEELKNSLKEKTKSKDAIEEVNRMFATVQRHEARDSLDDSNRPMIRNGPRVLPVVKTNRNSGNIARQENQECYNCRETYHMSSGDSMHECCHKQERYDDCCKCCRHKHCCSFSKDLEYKHAVDIHEH